jgi:prophage maintenance system killer protein
MMKEKRIFQPLSSKSVCQIYELLLEDRYVSFPLTQNARDKVDGLVGSILGSYFGNESFKTPEEKAIAYLYFIIKDHPFTDGNKRTATLTFLTLCRLNNLKPDLSEFSLDTYAIFIEKTNTDPHEFIGTLADILFRR